MSLTGFAGEQIYPSAGMSLTGFAGEQIYPDLIYDK